MELDPSTSVDQDPYLWLEDVLGEPALAWAREQNDRSRQALGSGPEFESLRDRLLAILESKARIPFVQRAQDHFYNFWQDSNHVRGVWRRTTLESYRQENPDWETLLDLDDLARSESENWVFSGAHVLVPGFHRALVSLSRGGADAVCIREFDLLKKTFLKDGFQLPEAKSFMTWYDEDTVFLGTDFGPGSRTDSGYPRIIKRWRRGELLSQAEVVFESESTDVSATIGIDRSTAIPRIVITRALDFYRSHQALWREGRIIPLQKPEDASVGFNKDFVFMELRSDWQAAGPDGPKCFKGGSLLIGDADSYVAGSNVFQEIFVPTKSKSLSGFSITKGHILLNILDRVQSRLEEIDISTKSFSRREVNAPFPGNISVGSLHDPRLAADDLGEHYLITYTDFLTPESLMLAKAGTDHRETLKARPPHFDATSMRAEQYEARSKDGTVIPYFVVRPKGSVDDGTNPTLLYGYGGFEVSLQPWYSGVFGSAWFERGGVLVVANIRGGGEFGPSWHQAALRHNRQRAFDDFIAVAENLHERKITSPRHLAIQGGSNGGLLVGAVMVQRPELFSAVVCQVPLLDMLRYHKLLAGASWMAEYGNPDDPEERDHLLRYSPYHHVRKDRRYPEALFTTSTRDDRVHPGHARKMVARMQALGHQVHYFENIEGGHAGAADAKQRADLLALEFTYLWKKLGAFSR